jgi:hypothetical protein
MVHGRAQTGRWPAAARSPPGQVSVAGLSCIDQDGPIAIRRPTVCARRKMEWRCTKRLMDAWDARGEQEKTTCHMGDDRPEHPFTSVAYLPGPLLPDKVSRPSGVETINASNTESRLP